MGFQADPKLAAEPDWTWDVAVNEIESLDLVREEMSVDARRRATDPFRTSMRKGTARGTR
jgi:hypothetical protein